MSPNFINALIFCLGAGIVSLLFAYLKSVWINKQDVGTPKTKEIGQAIQEGAMAFLKREYQLLSLFVLCVAILLFVANEGSVKLTAFSFVLGAVCSALAGFLACEWPQLPTPVPPPPPVTI